MGTETLDMRVTRRSEGEGGTGTKGKVETGTGRAKKLLQDPKVCEAPASPCTLGHNVHGPGESCPRKKQKPLSPNPVPRSGNLKFSRAKLFGKQRPFNHMNSHSRSYLFPASGFPPLANHTDQSSGAGSGRGASPKGWKTSKS